MEYIIVKAGSITQLQERVQELITEEGWEPLGGPMSVVIEAPFTRKWRYDHRPRQFEFVQSMTREAQE